MFPFNGECWLTAEAITALGITTPAAMAADPVKTCFSKLLLLIDDDIARRGSLIKSQSRINVNFICVLLKYFWWKSSVFKKIKGNCYSVILKVLSWHNKTIVYYNKLHKKWQ